MSEIFADVFEAIRYLRQEKGATEKAIVMHIRDRMGKRMGVSKFVKTVQTISRLVDDGLLIKKGKRIILPLPLKGNGDEASNMNQTVGAEEEGGDEDEEDEDEEDEEEDCDDEEDDDDDDDENCPNEDGDKNGKDNGNGKDKSGGEENSNGNGKEDSNCQMNEGIPLRRDENTDLEYKYLKSKMKKYMKSELNPMKYPIGRSKKPRHRTRLNKYDEMFDENSRSRSPVSHRRDDIELMMDMEGGLPESEGDARLNSSDFSFGYDERDEMEEISSLRYRSPNGPPPPNTPGVHVERKESCCSDLDSVADGLPHPEEDAARDVKLAKNESNSSGRCERVKEKQGKRRERDSDEIDEIKGDASVCPNCKKLKHPEYNLDRDD